MKHITNFLFVATEIAAIIWVSTSYFIAAYATIKLGQPFPVVELSQQAIDVLLGALIVKVTGNTFEHNDGKLFGTSDKSNQNRDA